MYLIASCVFETLIEDEDTEETFISVGVWCDTQYPFTTRRSFYHRMARGKDPYPYHHFELTTSLVKAWLAVLPM